MSSNKKILITIFAVLIFVLLCQPGAAQTITFADPLGTNQQILVYQIGGNNSSSLIGTYNTTEGQFTLDNGSYLFVLKPSGQGVISNPTVTIDWVGSLILVIFALALMLAVALTPIYLLLRLFGVWRK